MIPKVLRDFLDSLAEDILSPVLSKVRSLSWAAKCLVGLMTVVLLVTFRERDYVAEYVDLKRYHWRVDRNDKIPAISDRLRQDVNAARQLLREALIADLPKPSGSTWEPFTVSQIVAALAPDSGAQINSPVVMAFFRSPEQIDTKCHCWHQMPGRGDPNVAISAWVIYAMALLGEAATPQELNFLIESQLVASGRSRGSWPLYPGAKPEYASTYATARAVLALRAQLQYQQPPLRKQVEDAMHLGFVWLVENVQSQPVRWRLYPLIEGSEPSEGVSGVAMQALHALHHRDLDRFNTAWVRDLPRVIPESTAIEATGNYDHWTYFTDPKKKPEVDPIRHQRLSWLVVGAVEAHQDVSGLDKARALRWIEQAIQHTDLLLPKAPEPWNRAEKLIALNRLIGLYEVSEFRRP